MLDMSPELQKLLNQKKEVYNQTWKNQVKDLYVLNLKLKGEDTKKLISLVVELEILIDKATENVTLAIDSGI